MKGDFKMSEEKANQNAAEPQEEQDVNELIRIRMEKLKDLQEKGKDPFQIVKFDNKDNSKDIKEKYVDPVEGTEAPEVEVSIAGRLMAKRGHGKALHALSAHRREEKPQDRRNRTWYEHHQAAARADAQ